MKAYRVEIVVSAPFQQNALVVWKPERGECLVFDPGFDVESITEVIERNDLAVRAIVNTHGHADHIAGNRDMKARYPNAPLIIGQGDAAMLVDSRANLSGPFGVPLTSPPADRTVSDGDELELAGLRFLVREIPGHSPGSVVFICEAEEPPFAVVGDVVFAGSIGRFDFPGGDGRRLVRGVREKLLALPDRTVLYPGHGPATTVGTERHSNPYVGQGAPDDPGY